jgi:thioester reductase-like protein
MICGNDKTGACNPKDWFSRMLLTFKTLGKYPKPFQFNFHLVPVKMLSSFIIRGGIYSFLKFKELKIFNVSNTESLSYFSISGFLQQNFPNFSQISSYNDWFKIAILDKSSPLYDVKS